MFAHSSDNIFKSLFPARLKKLAPTNESLPFSRLTLLLCVCMSLCVILGRMSSVVSKRLKLMKLLHDMIYAKPTFCFFNVCYFLFSIVHMFNLACVCALCHIFSS